VGRQDRPAVEELVGEVFRASYRRLVTQLYAVTGDRVEAEDAVQEAFARAVASGERWRQVLNPEAWLRTVALNVVRTRARRSRLFARMIPRIGAPTDVPGVSEDHLAVVAAMRSLTYRQREVLALHYFADLPVADIAAELGVPEGTVKTRLKRARDAMGALMAPDSEPTEVDRA
jgi:RNA polymerase sigma-70 factor (ECF subfamily)